MHIGVNQFPGVSCLSWSVHRIDIVGVCITPDPFRRPGKPIGHRVGVGDAPIPVSTDVAAHAANAVTEQKAWCSGVCESEKVEAFASGKCVNREPPYNQPSIDGQSAEECRKTWAFKKCHEFLGVLEKVKHLGTCDATYGCGGCDATDPLVGHDGLRDGFGLWELVFLDFVMTPCSQQNSAHNAPKHISFSTEKMGLRKSTSSKECGGIHKQVDHFPAQHEADQGLHSQIQRVRPMADLDLLF